MKHHTPSIHEIEARHVAEAVGLTIEPTPHKRTRWEARLATTWGKGDRGAWSHERAICKGCGCEIDATPTVAEVAGTRMEIPSTVCGDCMALVREHYDPDAQPAEEPTKTPKWDAACPERYKQVVIGGVRPAFVDWEAFERVRAWRPDNPRGLGLIGAPGAGKTCAYWSLARDLELDGHAPITIGSLELFRVLAEAARDIRDVGWLYRSRILMIDDLGKERVTPAAAALLWEVLDRRLSANMPIIITSNFTGPQFAERFGEPHLGDSIRRRIRDLCTIIKFADPAGKPASRPADQDAA